MKVFTRVNQSSNHLELRPLRKGFFNRHVLIALLGLSIVYFLQAEQAECLGVVRKSEISVMTRRFASRTT